MNRLKTSMTRPLYGTFLIILLCLAIFSQSLDFAFLNFDDNVYITQNTSVQGGLRLDGIKSAFTEFGNPYYMPLTRMSFLLDSSIYGIDPMGFHLTNLVLHILNALLVLYLCWLLSRNFMFSLLTATLFAIHPQHIEAFIWISERKEVLSSLFGILSLILYVHHVNKLSVIKSGESACKYLLLAVLFFILSLLSKPAWITMPFILLLLDWWPLQRLKKHSIRNVLLEKLAFLLIAFGFSLIIYFSAASGTDYVINTIENLPLSQRILNSAVIYISYLSMTFYPVNLPVYVPYPEISLPIWKTAGAAFTLLLISFICFYQRKRYPYLLAGWLWFLGTLVPMIGILSAGETVFIANRWTYISHIGLFAAIVWTGIKTVRDYPGTGRYLGTAMVIIILALSVSSWVQTKHWQDSGTFWTQAINTTNNNHYAHYMLGEHYLQTNKPDRALDQFIKAFELEPDEPFYALQLGNLYGARGETERAWDYYRRIQTMGAANIKLLTEMGLVSIYNNRPRLALEFLQLAVDRPAEKPDQVKYKYLSQIYSAYAASLLGDPAGSVYLNRFINSAGDSRENLCQYAKIVTDRLDQQTGRNQSMAFMDTLCSFD